ncbi:hypothetical protein ACFFU1_18295 [Algibacter miyuki]|uniref:FCS-type domain-containing protein n=1 Tax=Algibacter miyuki TaxID=1306933 RepID=A0ABV5H6F4_9FLAO|nr:hypothetical protein [Algibacter miyuki]MDN3665793.1 hypothetical protein [Algibacter miyuki]
MKKTEVCLHCGDEYIPKRRGAQKFCTNSCRSRHWQTKQSNKTNEVVLSKVENTVEKQGAKVEAMSFAGVGNAAAGVAVVDGLKSLLTAKENKAATKKDIQELKTLIIGRFLPINNISIDSMGRCPFYDVETGSVVYM